MGLLDALLGRSKPVKPDLDALFALPSAAIGLQASTGLAATGTGSVCVKPVEGAAFARTQDEVEALLRLTQDTAVDAVPDAFGYSWTTVRAGPGDLPAVVSALHAANTTYERDGFGPGLLCSLVGLAGEVDGRPARLALVYLYKRGTFYPFAPLPGTDPSAPHHSDKRDTALELQVRAALGEELKVEPDLARWFPVWGAPGL